MEIHLRSEQLDSLVVLLEFVHSKHLPSMCVEDLLDLLELADHYMIPSCVSEVCKQLVGKRREISTVGKAIRVLELVKHLAVSMHPALLYSMEAAMDVLLSRYGDLEAVWQTDSLKIEFLELPRDVVVEILKSSRLKLGSENTVFLAVTAWLAKNYPDCTPIDPEYGQAAMQMGSCVRFPLLSMNFLTVWVPEAKWMKDFEDSSNLWTREALQYKAAGCKGQRASQESALNYRFTARTEASVKNEVFWKVHRDNVLHVLTNRKPLHSPRMFFGGYYWDIEVERNVVSSKLHIGVYLFAYGLDGDSGKLTRGPVQVECAYALKCQKHRNQGGDRVESLQMVKWDLGTGWGWQNFFMEESSRVLGDGSAYLDGNNYLHFRAQIQSIA